MEYWNIGEMESLTTEEMESAFAALRYNPAVRDHSGTNYGR